MVNAFFRSKTKQKENTKKQFMEKMKFLFCTLAFCMPLMVAAQGITINSTNFPDENFREYLHEQDFGEDGIITEEELKGIEQIAVYDRGISSLKGIEHFTALTVLACSNNQLSSLDVSKCTMLRDLSCENNLLTSLDMSGCSLLTGLSCDNNQLTTLNLSGCTALEFLRCQENKLTSLDLSRCAQLSEVWCYDNQLTTLNLSGCTALERVKCNYNQVTSLDLSGCAALTYLWASENQLTSLNVSGCSALTTMSCWGNKLTMLDVSECGALTELYCSGNQLTSLSVSGCPNLEKLSCDGNLLTSLDVSVCKKLNTLTCENNQLESLNVSGYTMLNTLLCMDNHLKTLDMSGCAALTELTLGNNPLASLNASGCTSLTILECRLAQLTDLNITGCTTLEKLCCNYNHLTSLDVSGCTSLTSIECYNNEIKDEKMDAFISSLPQYETTENHLLYIIGEDNDFFGYNEGNVCTKVQVEAAKAKGWLLMDNEGREYNGLVEEPEGIAIDEVNFPDEAFRNWLLEQKYGEDSVLTEEEISKIISIDVSGQGIGSLQGIELFTALESLICEKTKLTDLDLSGCAALFELTCTGNPNLKSLNVSGCPTLKFLHCSGNETLASLDVSDCTALMMIEGMNNKLTSLNVSGCTAMQYLYCNNNELETLDVSGCTMLEKLYCLGNQLTSILVSECESLTQIDCSQNQIAGEAMDAFISSLPMAEGGKLCVYDNKNAGEGNACTKTQVAAAAAKGWTTYCTDFTEYEGSDGEPEVDQPEGIAIDEVTFPDEAFRNWLLAQEWGKDSVLTDEEIAGITEISFPGKDVKSLQGIKLFTALEKLTCNNTQLGILDVSDCTKLTTLVCNYNDNLISLNVSGCTALKSVSCYNNPLLEALDVSGLSSLTDLHCPGNQSMKSLNVTSCTSLVTIEANANKLTSLDVSGCIALEQLTCNYNELTVLTVSGCEALKALSCVSNQLTSLDVSGCVNLESLNCEGNQLVSLDISGCVALTEINCSDNQLAGEAMTALVDGLPQLSENDGKLYVYNNKGVAEGNVCTKKQVAAAKAKGWTPYYYNGAWPWVEYEGSDDDDEQELAAAKAEATESLTKAQAVKYDESEFDGKIEDINAAIKGIEAAYEALKAKVENSDITLSDDISKELEAIASEVDSLETLSKEATAAKENVSSYFTDYNAALEKYEADIDAATAVDSLNSIKESISKSMASAQAKLAEASTKLSDINAILEALQDRIADCSDAVDDYEGGSGNGDDNSGNTDDEDDGNGDDNGDDDDPETPETPGGPETPETPDVVIDEETFPDENFRDILSELIGGEAGDVLTEEEIKEITSLDISEAGISDLTGIEYLTALTELVCEGNKLESLDVSKNTALTMIDCSRNQISGEAMDAFISSLPEKTAAARATANDAAEVYVLRVYDSTADDEGNVCTKAQVEAIKAKGWTPYYYNGSEWLEYTGYDDETTGISWLGTGDGSVSVYNMAGQKVNLPANAKKGVYIVNGKKVVVK